MNATARIQQLLKQIPTSYNASEEIQMDLLTSAGCVDLTRSCRQLCGSWNGIPVTCMYASTWGGEEPIALLIVLGNLSSGGSVRIRTTACATEIQFDNNYRGPWDQYQSVNTDKVQAFLKAFMPQFCTLKSWHREGISPSYTYQIVMPDRKDMLTRSAFPSDDAFRLAVSDALAQQDAAWRQEIAVGNFVLKLPLRSPQAKYLVDDFFPQKRQQGASYVELNLHEAIELWKSLANLPQRGAAANLRMRVETMVFGATNIPIQDLA